MKERATGSFVMGNYAKVAAARYGDREAFYCVTTGKHLTYREFNLRCNALGNGLLSLGVRKGDAAAFLTYNRVEIAETYFALAKIGVMGIPLNYRLSAGEIVELVNFGEAETFIFDPSFSDLVGEMREKMPQIKRFVCMGGEIPDFALSYEELMSRLLALKPALHNTTDLKDRERLIRAIEIAVYARGHKPAPTPEVRALILGTQWERAVLRQRIAARLTERLNGGLVEEVESLHARGCPWERLESLGLEYRFVAAYLQGRIKNRNDLFQKLNAAIVRFAKRQDTWFRRMERNGTAIHWIARADFDAAMDVVRVRV